MSPTGIPSNETAFSEPEQKIPLPRIFESFHLKLSVDQGPHFFLFHRKKSKVRFAFSWGFKTESFSSSSQEFPESAGVVDVGSGLPPLNFDRNHEPVESFKNPAR
jgi:hypothetical protein